MQSIKDIKQLFEQTEKEQWNALFPQYKTDERAGVQKLITQYENKLLKHKKEQERLYRMLEFANTGMNFPVSAVLMRQGADRLRDLLLQGQSFCQKDLRLKG